MDPVTRRPSRSLVGHVAIVTGAGAAGNGIGNGRATSILLAEAGCNVVCVDLDLSLAQRTVEMIAEENEPTTTTSANQPHVAGQAVALSADVTDAVSCQQIVEEALSRFGRLDILVNNVGVGGARGTALDVDMAEWAKSMEVNVASMVTMAKYAIPAMMRNDNTAGYRGSIINLGSVAGIRGGNPHLLYPTAKGAVVNMTRAMAAHHAPDGIRVNCVCPGMLYTPMMYAGGMSEEARQSRRNRSLLKTEGTGWDCGAAVRFLAGEESRWITGILLPVDAGATCAVGTDIPDLAAASVNP